MTSSYTDGTIVQDPSNLNKSPNNNGSFTTVGQKSGEGSDPDKPDYICDFYRLQLERWRMVDTLWDGTEAMRIAGERYLPKFQNEANDIWRLRISKAVLLNYFRKTVQGYVGKPFGKPLVVPDDMPQQLKDYFEDVDGQGMSLDMFAQMGFEKGLCKGSVNVFVDYPTAAEGETALDEADRMPIMRLVYPEEVIGARKDVKDPDVLGQVRLVEICKEPDGKFGEKTVRRIRVLEPGKWYLYEAGEPAAGQKTQWTLKSEGPISLDEIPFSVFLADEQGFMMSRPPLLDLAYKNVEHWQSASDQQNILAVSRFPLLVAVGVNPADPMSIGPNSFFALREPQADIKFVEHGGTSIGVGRQDLEDKKAEMAILGLSLLMPQATGAPTATAKAIDGAEAVTELQRIVSLYENFINEAIYWAALWMELPEADNLPRVTVNGDYAKLLSIDSSVQALLTARSAGDISRKALIDAFKRRNLLPADFSIDDDAEELSTEKAKEPQGLPTAIPGKPGLIPSKDGQQTSGDKKPNPFAPKPTTQP